jgi:uncharacterized protein
MNSVIQGKLADNIMHFGRVLRVAGLPVGPSAVLDAIDAAQSGTLRERQDFYWTLHAIFVKRRDQSEIFDQAFHVFWKRPKILERLMRAMLRQAPTLPNDEKKRAGSRRLSEALEPHADAREFPKPRQETIELDMSLTTSAQEVLRRKDFEQMSSNELSEVKNAIAKLRLHQSEIKTRRFQNSNSGTRIDMRRSFKSALRGQVMLVRKQIIKRLPPLVVLCDISGSCSSYSRIFLHFLHALSNDRTRVTIFLFGTRLTNVTRDLQRRDADEAVAKVSDHVQDWSGGTRIGTALHEFNFKWGRRVLAGGAHVLLMTDGLEREDVKVLTEEMQRLRRSTKRIVWLNPLLRFDKFEAKAGGIRAIMPLVDEFRAVHSLDSLVDLATTLASPRSSRHDPKRWLEKIS